jgi:hypothetical protein
MKHVDALKSISVWASIATSLSHLTMIGTKKLVLDLKIGWDHFSLHDALRSNLAIFTKIGHAHFSTPLVTDW